MTSEHITEPRLPCNKSCEKAKPFVDYENAPKGRHSSQDFDGAPKGFEYRPFPSTVEHQLASRTLLQVLVFADELAMPALTRVFLLPR